MTDQAATGVMTPGRTKAVASALAGAVLALAAALAGGTGDVQITAAPHPGLTARVDAIDLRVAALERRVEESAQLATLVEGIRSRLDLLLSGARVRLDDGEPPPRSRR